MTDNIRYTFNFLALLLVMMMIGCAAKKDLIETEAPKEKVQLPGSYFWAVKPEINIRSQATLNSGKVGQLNDGDSVLVLENINGWYNIIAENNQQGWIRSDLLGPRKVSVFAKAVSYVDSLASNEGIDLYFDKKLLHRRIYIMFPDNAYTSQTDIRNHTGQLVRDYQQKVYRGDVTARVLKPGSQEEYLTQEYSGTVNPDVKLPVLPFGILRDVDISVPQEIKLTVEAPEETDKKQLLTTVRNIVSIYPISYSAVEMLFIANSDSCLMWFREDESGENYKFGQCAGQ